MILGSAAVLAVYSAGYFRTRAAAQQFDVADLASRRPARPAVSLPASTPVPVAVVSGAVVVSKVESEVSRVSNVPAPATVPGKPSPVPAPATSAAAEVVVVPAALPAPVAVATASVVTPASAPVATAIESTAAVTPAAPAGDVVAKVAEAPRPKWKDGKFSGWGSCRHGDIQATIEIKDGRIISAVVSDCRTRYSCDVIDKIIPQVVARQSADVDTVSGATQSADAFYYAVTGALASAKPEAVKAL